jgi:hypothetical protein
MKGITEDFLLFVVGIFVILIILTTIFGRGIIYGILGTLAESEPSYLQEDIRTILTTASYSPGEYYAKIKIPFKNTILLNDTPYPSLHVKSTKTQFVFSNTTPIAFLTECELVKSCTKSCGLIGDACSILTDCCGVLDCQFGKCNSSTCGNGIIEPGEECEIGVDETYCPGQCKNNCICPILHGIKISQCKDGGDNDGDTLIDRFDPGCHSDDDATNPLSYVESDDTESIFSHCDDGRDNDGDTLIDKDDPSCHTDGDPLNLASYDSSKNREYKIVGEPCKSNSECWSKGLACVNKIIFEKIDENLVIRKFFEGGKCKIKIERG